MRGQRLYYGLAWVLLTISALCLISKIFLNSDTLFLESLTQDIFTNHGLWADWQLTPAPAYVPDMLLYFISSTFLPSVVLRIFFVSFCQVFILTFITLWLAKKIQPTLSLFAKGTIILVITFLNLVAIHSGMWFYFYSADNHFTVLVFALLVLGLLLTFIERPSLRRGFIIVLACALAKASSAVFVIAFLFPAIVTCVFAIIIIGQESVLKPYKLRILSIIGLLILSLGLAHLIEWFLTYHSILSSRVPMSVAAAGNSFEMFLNSLQVVFLTDNIYTFSLSLFVLWIFLFLIINTLLRIQMHHNKTTNQIDGVLLQLTSTEATMTNWKLNACYLLLLFILPINLLGSICSGGIIDVAGLRYFTVPIALAILLVTVILDQSHRANKLLRLALLFSFLVLTGLTIFTVKTVYYKSSLSSLITTVYQNSHDETAVANCINQLKAKHIPLNAGISDYWFARGVTFRTQDNTPIEATLNDLTPFFWMSTVGPFLHQERYAPRTYNFIIVRADNDNRYPFNYHAMELRKIIPNKHIQFLCDDTEATIWFYPNNQLDKIVKDKQHQLISTREFKKPHGFCKVVNRC